MKRDRIRDFGMTEKNETSFVTDSLLSDFSVP